MSTTPRLSARGVRRAARTDAVVDALAVVPWTADHDWPRTSRLMPWLLACFIAMLFLVPFDVAELPVQLPFDLRLDRLVLGAIFVLWVTSIAIGGRLAPRMRWSATHVALLAFFIATVLSVAINLEVLVNLDEHSRALKQIVLLVSYVALFFFVTSVIRPSEVRSFINLVLGLACVMALGVLVESRLKTNFFYEWSDTLLPGFTVPTAPIERGIDGVGRLRITGPTQHGLAVTTMMAMLLPFAILRVMEGPRKWVGALACALIMAAALATLRKTAMVAPIGAILVMIAYRPRAMARLAPLGVVLLVVIHFMSPGSLGRVGNQLFGGTVATTNSTRDRVEDYDAVSPDILHRLVTGRGYGTFDPRRYRFTDNEYLQLIVTTGIVGLAAYIALIVSVGVVAHPVIRRGGRRRAGPALAASAAAVAFAFTNALYDTLAFPHAPYLFLLIAALAVATASARSPTRQ